MSGLVNRLLREHYYKYEKGDKSEWQTSNDTNPTPSSVQDVPTVLPSATVTPPVRPKPSTVYRVHAPQPPITQPIKMDDLGAVEGFPGFIPKSYSARKKK